MSENTPIASVARKANNLGAFFRSEVALFVGLGTATFFLVLGPGGVEHGGHPLLLGLVFIWLFLAVLWSAISVVRHADFLALKCGEPYGTLILTLAAISIEVMMVSAAMLHGTNNPTLARDTMFAVLMIALNGLVGLSLLLGGLRHKEQYYNLQGTGSYLNAIMTLAVLGLVLPSFTTSVSGAELSGPQETFLIIAALSLYGVFLFVQTRRHTEHYKDTASGLGGSEADHSQGVAHSATYHSVLLFLYLIIVVILAEKFAIPLDDSIERFGMPQAFGGAIVAGLVLAPEALSGIQAALRNRLQRSINILHGSVLATIGLTIPAILITGMVTKREVTLGIGGANLPLLVLTLAVSVVTFGSGRTNVLQGCIHLLLFAVFLLLIFCP